MKKLYVPIYKVWALLFEDRDEYNRWRIKHEGDQADKTCIAHSSWFADHNTATLFLPRKTTTGTIAHECYHAAGFILESRGVCHGPFHHEALAYLLGFLVNEVTRCRHRKSAASKAQKRSSKRT